MSDGHTCWGGVHSLRLHGRPGHVRYVVRFNDGGRISAGLFDDYLTALRHAQASAEKRSHAHSRRAIPAVSRRWAWRSGDLEETAVRAARVMNGGDS